jgi:plasmid stabilization system protein ParE
MPDIILDANVPGDFFEQFFSPSKANRGRGPFSRGPFLSDAAARELNRIVRMHADRDSPATDLVVISPFGFIELARRWPEIGQGRYSVDQVRAFVSQPPEWVSVATLDETILPSFLDVPTHVWARGEFRAMEWTDAIYAATALARGDSNLLATTDACLQAANLGRRLRCV